MKCKRARDLILSDYIDGELKGSLRIELEQHLAGCGDCRRFKEIAEKKAAAPFRSSKTIEPPESVWQYIKESIQEEGRISRYSPNRAMAFFAGRQALAGALIALMLIGAIFVKSHFYTRDDLNGYIEEQIEFLTLLEADDVEYTNGSYADSDLVNAIDEYFL